MSFHSCHPDLLESAFGMVFYGLSCVNACEVLTSAFIHVVVLFNI